MLRRFAQQFLNLTPPANGWRRTMFVVGLVLSMTVWFGSRVYLHYHIEPMWHPMAKAYQDMAVTLDDGGKFGEINVSRIARNRDVTPIEPYKTAVQPGDAHCQYRTLDPGYGVIFAAAREIFFFVPDTQMRPVLLQMFFDFLLPFLLFVTFYRWGWFAAVGSVVLYSANAVFAVSTITAWTYFWDELVCILALISLLWLYRLAKENTTVRWAMILLAVTLGAVLGAGVWIRNSWFLFGAALLVMAAFSKTLRPWLIYAAITFGIFAGGMALRSTWLNGYPSISTRMVWHTAFQGIGKYANPYGIEDDDLYMFTRTYKESGVHFNYCNYNAHDLGVQKDVLGIWQSDKPFIIRSIAQRIFSNTFLNFNGGNYQLWNYGMLGFALIGVIFGLWAGGEIAMFAVLSFAMFMLMNVSYAFVYYLFRQYSGPTQALLLFSAMAAIGAVGKFIQHCRLQHWPKFRLHAFGWNGPTLANIVFIVSALLIMIIMLPPVQHYLTPHFPASMKAIMPDEGEMILDGLKFQVDQLPSAKKQAFLNYIQKTAHTDDIKVFAKDDLKHLTFINTDGSLHPVWLVKRTSIDAQEVLMRASRSIAGVGYQWINGFDPGNPRSWDGNEITFALVKNPELGPEQVNKLLQDKFADWNWRLAEQPDHSYIAVHTKETCSPMRRELAKFFADQCDAP